MAHKLIRRIVSHEVESTFGKIDLPQLLVVHSRQIQQGDVIVPIGEIEDATLLDLAQTHPKDYAQHALDRGLVTLEEEVVELGDDDDSEEEDGFTDAQIALMEASAADAIAMIAAAAEDVELLALYSEAEASKAKPRKTVLEALSAAMV